MRFCFFLPIFITVSVHCSAQTVNNFFILDKTPKLAKIASFKASALCDVAGETKKYLTTLLLNPLSKAVTMT